MAIYVYIGVTEVKSEQKLPVNWFWILKIKFGRKFGYI